MSVIKFGPEPTVPYQRMYSTLFNAITDALGLMEEKELMRARAVLMDAQRETEELYVEGDGR